ncbi:MAG: hypothetical protein AB7T38_16945 [Nitrospirales bacterium]
MVRLLRRYAKTQKALKACDEGHIGSQHLREGFMKSFQRNLCLTTQEGDRQTPFMTRISDNLSQSKFKILIPPNPGTFATAGA